MKELPILRGERSIDALGIAIGVVLSGMAFWLAIVPVMNQRSIQTARATELSNIKAELEDHRARQSGTQVAIDRLRSELARCEVKLAATSSLNTRIMELSELATESGLEVVTIKGEDAKQANKRVYVPVKVIARGQYFAVARFLKDINVRFRDTAVDKFAAAAERSEKESGDAVVEIDLSWYAVYEGASDMATAPNP